jgi:hypothetical protein
MKIEVYFIILDVWPSTVHSGGGAVQEDYDDKRYLQGTARSKRNYILIDNVKILISTS